MERGDSGHAQVKMVADVYSHIIDEDRRLNAQRFEEAFYSGHGAAAAGQMETTQTAEREAAASGQAEAAHPAADTEPVPEQGAGGSRESDMELLMKLLQKPEIAAMLKTLAKAI